MASKSKAAQPFIQVPLRALATKFLRDSELRVLLVLYAFYNKEVRRAWPSLTRLCEVTGYSRTTVSRAVKGLTNKRVVFIHRNEGKSTHYEINPYFLISQ